MHPPAAPKAPAGCASREPGETGPHRASWEGGQGSKLETHSSPRSRRPRASSKERTRVRSPSTAGPRAAVHPPGPGRGPSTRPGREELWGREGAQHRRSPSGGGDRDLGGRAGPASHRPARSESRGGTMGPRPPGQKAAARRSGDVMCSRGGRSVDPVMTAHRPDPGPRVTVHVV